jgi:methyl-accepting chemotaxis protein
VVTETVSAIDQIARSSERISSISKVIDDIAFQTNILALNAGVEAARAGEAGKGFAVVASAVRSLAQRSSDAAREINDLIADSTSQVNRGVTLVGKTGDTLEQIVDSIAHIARLVSGIAASSQQQSVGLAEINEAVNELDQATQQNAARLEETTAAAESLTNDAVTLVDTVEHFRIEREPVPGAMAVSFRRSEGAAEDRGRVPRQAAAGRRREADPAMAHGWTEF